MKIVFSVFFTCYCGISFMMRDLFKKYYAQICITEHFFIEIMVNQEQIKRGGLLAIGSESKQMDDGKGVDMLRVNSSVYNSKVKL